MNTRSSKTKTQFPILALVLTGLFLFVLFPSLLYLDRFPVMEKKLGREELVMLFGIFTGATLLLAGITVSAWPAPLHENADIKAFPRIYRILAPLKLIRDRKSRPHRDTRRQQRSRLEAVPKPNPGSGIPYHKWATIPLFPKDGSDLNLTFLDLVPNGILLIDNEGRILEASQVTEKIFGRNRDGIVKTSVTDIIPKLFPNSEDSETCEKFSFQGLESEVYGISRETFCLSEKGEKIPIQLRMSKQEAYGNLVFAIEVLPTQDSL